MKEKISMYYRILIVLISGYALFINFRMVSFNEGILYFTYISNLLCFVYFFVLVIRTLIAKKESNSDFHHIVKGTITMAITLTFFMYNIALRNDPTSALFIGHAFECNMVHVVVPLMVMGDYAIFVGKGYQKDYYPFIWSTVLILYQIFVIIYVAYGGRFINNLTYPYSYMDVGKYGVFTVTVNLLIIYMLFMLYGIIIQKLDNYIGQRKKNM